MLLGVILKVNVSLFEAGSLIKELRFISNL
jgi:hypothetical protein